MGAAALLIWRGVLGVRAIFPVTEPNFDSDLENFRGNFFEGVFTFPSFPPTPTPVGSWILQDIMEILHMLVWEWI
jgi:hypothetical protein